MYSREQHAAFTRSISLEINNPTLLFNEHVQATVSRVEKIALERKSFDNIFAAIQAELKATSIPSCVKQAIARGVKRFINTRDCMLDKRYEKKTLFLDISWVSETESFKVFNSRMDRLIDSFNPENKSETTWQDKLQIGVSGALNFVNGCIQYAAEHPVQTLTLILLSQVVLADAKRTADAVISANNTTDLDDGLVAYFPFDGNALDASGNNNNGEVFGATPTIDRFNVPNSAYYFNGTSYVKGIATNFPTQDRSVAMWLNPTEYNYSEGRNGGGIFFGYGGNTPCGTSFITVLNYLCAVPANSFDIEAFCTVDRVLYINNTLANTLMNKWSFFTFTTDANEGSNVYLNGTLVWSVPSVAFSNTYVLQKNFGIGTGVSPMGMAPYQDNCAMNFMGAIDEVRVYNRSLTQDEITDLYTETNKPTVQPLITTPAATTPITTTVIPTQIANVTNTTTSPPCTESQGLQFGILAGIGLFAGGCLTACAVAGGAAAVYRLINKKQDGIYPSPIDTTIGEKLMDECIDKANENTKLLRS